MNLCRKKMMQKQAEYEEQIEVMLQKISQLEKAKSRLQSEVEVLIVDLEKVNRSAWLYMINVVSLFRRRIPSPFLSAPRSSSRSSCLT